MVIWLPLHRTLFILIPSFCNILCLNPLYSAAGFAVTEFVGQDRDGTLTVLNSAMARRHRQMVRALVEHIDLVAFITVDDVHPLQHGYFRH